MQINARTSQVLPAISADGTFPTVRLNRYGEVVGVNSLGPLQAAAGEFSCRIATNATPGTGIAQGIQTTFSDTANVLAILVNTATAGGVSIYLDRLKLINTVAGATTSASDLVVTTDTVDRYSSGGATITPVNQNSGGSDATVATLRFGACTATAVTMRRIVGRARLKTQAAPCWTIGDCVDVVFSSDTTVGWNTTGAGTQILPFHLSPVVVAPGHSALFHLFNTANATTAPSWEFSLSWIER